MQKGPSTSCQFLEWLCLFQPSSLHTSGPESSLSTGLWDWLITLFVPIVCICVCVVWRGGRTWLIYSVWKEEGALSPLPHFLNTPQALFMHVLISTVTNDLIFGKVSRRSLGRVAGRWGLCLGHFWFVCTKRPSCGCHSRLMPILGVMTSFCTWCEGGQLKKFRFHGSRKGNMKCCSLLYSQHTPISLIPVFRSWLFLAANSKWGWKIDLHCSVGHLDLSVSIKITVFEADKIFWWERKKRFSISAQNYVSKEEFKHCCSGLLKSFFPSIFFPEEVQMISSLVPLDTASWKWRPVLRH